MDEPFTGLDPVNVVLLREAFPELRDRGRTLIFSTHQMEMVEALCESVAIIDHGRMVAGGRCATSSGASGRRTVRLAVEGELAPTWLAELPGVVGSVPTMAGSHLELVPGADSAAILLRRPRRVQARCPVRGRRADPRAAVHRARRAAGGRRAPALDRRCRHGSLSTSGVT